MSALQLQPKLKKVVLGHTVRASVMKALNLGEDQYQKVESDPHIRNDLGADSLEEAEIVMCVEEMHGLDEIPEDYARKAERISHIYNYVFDNCQKDLGEIVDFKNQEHMPKILLRKIEKEFSIEENALDSCDSISSVTEKLSALLKDE